MAFKEIFVILVLVHVVGSITVRNCKGRGKTVQVQGGKMMLSRNLRALRVTGRVRITRRGMAPFRYSATLWRKIRGNRFRRRFCPRRVCNRRLKCNAIASVLYGARCTPHLQPGLKTIKSRWRRVSLRLGKVLARVKTGQFKIVARLTGWGLYGCFVLTAR